MGNDQGVLTMVPTPAFPLSPPLLTPACWKAPMLLRPPVIDDRVFPARRCRAVVVGDVEVGGGGRLVVGAEVDASAGPVLLLVLVLAVVETEIFPPLVVSEIRGVFHVVVVVVVVEPDASPESDDPPAAPVIVSFFTAAGEG